MKTFYVLEPHLDGTTKYSPGDKRDADENDVKHLIDLNVLDDKPQKNVKAPTAPDYERDGLGAIDLKKASKDQLLVIAAYEKAEVPEGDKATVADLTKAIDAKRKA